VKTGLPVAQNVIKNIMKFLRNRNIIRIILVSILGMVTHFSFAQNEKIEITFLGNCGFFMTDGNLNIYVDFPYKSGAYGYMTYSHGLLDSIHANSVFLYTHGHADHYSKKAFKKTNQKLYGPWTVKLLVGKKRKYKLDELNDSLPGFLITEYKTKHGLSYKHLSYLVEWNKKRIYISGDTHVADTLASAKNLDLVFAAPWVLYDAMEKDFKINAEKIIPYHLRSGENIPVDSDKIIILQQNQKFVLE
jgi:L-ascorbate metabolism protein UlaG (beta-lactamase superfamily)